MTIAVIVDTLTPSYYIGLVSSDEIHFTFEESM